jgi:hypothetical protein
MRQSNEPHPRPLMQHLLDVRFSPKRFESELLYERLGVLFIKRYVPTGGDFFIRRYGIRIAHLRGNLTLTFGKGPIAADQQMTGALPTGDKRGRKTVLY